MADNLFLAIHGNTQNGDVARADWEPIVGTSGLWQLETVQSAEPDGYGTYRWSYDSTSYLPVAASIESVQNEGYHKIACGGFSAGCDMLLRAVTFSPVRCDLLILQSPWIPKIWFVPFRKRTSSFRFSAAQRMRTAFQWQSSYML